MEVYGKLRIAAHGRMWYIYIYVAYVHNPEVHGRFDRLNLKKEMVVLGEKPWRSLA